MRIILFALLLIAFAYAAKKCSSKSVLKCQQKSNAVFAKCLKVGPNPPYKVIVTCSEKSCCKKTYARRVIKGKFTYIRVLSICYKKGTKQVKKSCSLKPHGAGKRKLCCKVVTVEAYLGKSLRTTKEILSKKCKWVGKEIPPPVQSVIKEVCHTRAFNKYHERKMCCLQLHTVVDGVKKVSPVYDCKWVGEKECKDLPEWLDNVKFTSADDLKDRAVAQCNDKNKFIFYSCVYDASLGLHKGKAEYQRLLNLEKVAQASHKLQCYSWGDPHLKTFYDLHYDIYNKDGNRVLYENGDYKITATIAFSHLWGLKGVNTALRVEVGDNETKFDVKGLTFNKLHWRRHGNQYHYTDKQLEIRVDCNVNHINVWVTGKKQHVDGCKGDCCYRSKKEDRLKDIHPDRVAFRSQCVRKWVALENCKKAAQTLHPSHQAAWIKNCVIGQRDQY